MNVYGNGGSEVNFYSNNDKTVQSQIWGVTSWEDAKKEIDNFLGELNWLD